MVLSASIGRAWINFSRPGSSLSFSGWCAMMGVFSALSSVSVARVVAGATVSSWGPLPISLASILISRSWSAWPCDCAAGWSIAAVSD